MLRIRLSDRDLTGVRFAVSPVNQVVTHAAQPGRGPGVSGSAAGLVFRMLALRSGDRPDFLTPVSLASRDGIDLGVELDAVRATSGAVLAQELGAYRVPARMGDLVALAEGSQRVKDRVADGLHQIHRTVFGRDWDAARTVLCADIARRSTDLGYYGLDNVLSGLHPRISFEGGVLTVHSDRTAPDIEGTGKGLVLVPTLVSRRITVKINARDPIVVGYPISGAVQPARSALLRLRSIIGQSRALIMLTLLDHPGSSTSEVARRCGIAISSASEHATALRQAGLVRSHREGNRMVHSLSSTGAQLAMPRT